MIATDPRPSRARLGWVTSTDPLSGVLPAVVGATALLSSPRAFVVARVDEGGICVSAAGAVDLYDVFEARAFTEEQELRWVRRDNSGDAVLLGERISEDTALGSRSNRTTGEALGLETTEVGYVLWGEPAPLADQRPGWRTLTSARIGTLRVPGEWSDPMPERLSLVAREYVAFDQPYGNAFVFDELLIGLRDGEVVDA